MKKKRHVGLTILIVVLAIIVLIPVSAFCYLQFGGWDPEQMHAADAAKAPYQGTAKFLSDGVVEVPLGNNDVYWLAGQYDVEQALEDEGLGKLVRAYALEIEQDGLTLYVDARLGFVPIPLKIRTDAVCSKQSVDLTIREIRLGKLVTVPLEKLAAFDVPERFSIDLDDIVENSKITEIAFEPGRAVIQLQFMEEFAPDALSAIRRTGYAQALYIYEGEKALIEEPIMGILLGSKPAHNGEDADPGRITAAVADLGAPADMLQTLFALCSDKEADQLAEACDAFERHFILGQIPERAGEERAAYIARIVRAQTVYERLLDALRAKYQKLELAIDLTQFVDAVTGEPLSLQSLCPEAIIDEAQSRAFIIFSYDACNAVKVFDMPLIRDVPCKNRTPLAGQYTNMRYDLSILLRLPCGLAACIYHQGDGQFVVNCLDEAFAEELLKERVLPIRMSDGLPRPNTRMRQPALAEGISDYAILVPEGAA